ncbi:isoflavone reductase protein [Rutstroemia sp. NJR-2017a BBW]|nr:isoflavone reductase protein [Rutstroemia sp. NJR-2017a BBW]
MANNMMRVAIVGSGGLAQVFAHHINETVHPFIILSRRARPDLEAFGYQVAVVNYESQEDLRFHLRGIDVVISTISGIPQINLIDAAARSRVLRFIPAEFCDKLAGRPNHDPLDRGRAATIERLQHWARHTRHQMNFTVFDCGVFYERFARGGLASLDIGASAGLSSEGSYLLNMTANTAEIVEYNSAGQPVWVSMTSVEDVARFVAAALALDLRTWPIEFRMQGDKKTVTEILRYAEVVKGQGPFVTTRYTPGQLSAYLQQAIIYQDYAQATRLQELIATEQRRYDFSLANLNALVDVQPISFWNWLSSHWGFQ